MQLAAYLAERDITDADFAARIGVDRSTVTRMRSGQRPRTDEVMQNIVRETTGLVTANDFYGIVQDDAA